MRTNTNYFSCSVTFMILLISLGYVNAGDNFVGSSSFGATCTDEGNTKTCSCTPPKTSSDCAKLLDNCKNTAVKVDPWKDDLGHEHSHQWVPDVRCTATKCVCDWIEKTSNRLPTQTMPTGDVLAPTDTKPKPRIPTQKIFRWNAR